MLKTAAEFIAEARARIECVDAAGARASYDESGAAVIIDVREPGEAAAAALDVAVNVPRGLIEMKVPGLCPDPDTVIFTHCAGGGRASLAAATLRDMGYTRVCAIVAPFEDIKRAFD